MNAISEYNAQRYPIRVVSIGTAWRSTGTAIYVSDLELRISRIGSELGTERRITFDAQIIPADRERPTLQAERALKWANEQGVHEKPIEEIRVPQAIAQEIKELVRESLDPNTPQGQVQDQKKRISQVIENANLFT